VSEEAKLDPEAVAKMREEFREQLQHMDIKDLLLEAAVNSRVAVRVLYRNVEPRISKLETRGQVLVGILISLNAILPVVFGTIGFFLGHR
jgi:hypothetical protein